MSAKSSTVFNVARQRSVLICLGVCCLFFSTAFIAAGPASALDPFKGKADTIPVLRAQLLVMACLLLGHAAWRMPPKRALTVMLGALGLSYLIPFDYPGLMEAEILTKIDQIKDAGLFARDLVIPTTSLAGGYNFFAQVYAPVPARWLPDAIYFSWLLCLSFIALFFYLTLKRLFSSPRPALGALLATGLVFACYRWDRWGAFVLGDNSLVYPFFRHQTIALTLALFCLYFYWRDSIIVAALLAGMAINFHINTGQHLLLLLVLDWVLIRRKNWSGMLRFLALTLGVALPTLVPTIWVELLAPRRDPTVPNPYILVAAYFRAPHHHLPSTWAPVLYFRFALLLIVFGAFWLARKGRELIDRRCLLIVGTALAALAAVYVFVEKIPVDLIAKTQLARMTIFIMVVAVLYVADRSARVMDRILLHRGRGMSPALVAAMMLPALILPLSGRHKVGDRAPTPLEQFIRAHTSTAALFMVPPIYTFDHFEQQTRRSTVVNIKRMPFTGDSLVEYLRRLYRIMGLEPRYDFQGSAELVGRYKFFDDYYHGLTENQLRQLHDIYHFDYVVWSDRRPAPGCLALEFKGDRYNLYRYKPSL